MDVIIKISRTGAEVAALPVVVETTDNAELLVAAIAEALDEHAAESYEVWFEEPPE